MGANFDRAACEKPVGNFDKDSAEKKQRVAAEEARANVGGRNSRQPICGRRLMGNEPKPGSYPQTALVIHRYRGSYPQAEWELREIL